MITKIQSIHLVLVSCMFKPANLIFSAEQDKALKGAIYEFET